MKDDNMFIALVSKEFSAKKDHFYGCVINMNYIMSMYGTHVSAGEKGIGTAIHLSNGETLFLVEHLRDLLKRLKILGFGDDDRGDDDKEPKPTPPPPPSITKEDFERMLGNN